MYVFAITTTPFNLELSKFDKNILHVDIRNGMPKFQRSRLNGVAVIAKTYTHIHTHILPNFGNT